MIFTAMLIAAAAPSAVDAERAFAAKAQTDGMWTAFRATATEDAIMFLPQPSNAQAFLKDRKDPAVGYMWWPAKAFVSCDGTAAVTTGPSVRGAVKGYFTTLWVRQPDGGWKWVIDHGDVLAQPRTAGERTDVRNARCSGAAPQAPAPAAAGDGKTGSGASRDGSLRWNWVVAPDGGRRFDVLLRNGRTYDNVLTDVIAAPTQ